MKKVSNKELKEIIKNATEKAMKDNADKFTDDLVDEVQGKNDCEAAYICLATLYRQSYDAISDVLVEILEHLS